MSEADKLLADLKEAYHLEELALEVLAFLANSEQELAPFNVEERRRIGNMLTEMGNDEQRHIKMIGTLISRVKKD